MTSHSLIKSSLEGARRRRARPVQPKEPLPVDTVCRIADHYISGSSLAVIRFLFILLVGFAGFFRMDEIRNLSVKDVSISSEYMSVFIPKRYNDQYREMHTSLLARSHKRLLAQFLIPRGYSSFFLHPESHLPKEYFHASKGVLCMTLREEFRKYVKPFVNDIARYGTHSIKHDAASNPACIRVFLLICWACMPAGYVPFQRKDTLSKLLIIVIA